MPGHVAESKLGEKASRAPRGSVRILQLEAVAGNSQVRPTGPSIIRSQPAPHPALSLHLEHLNPEQLAAVTLPDQHALILAGAGSGKTRVLTTRIAWLIQSARVSPGGVLAVTFTNKAAREMHTRLTAMLPVNPHGMWIGTFHGLSNRLLRAHHQEAG